MTKPWSQIISEAIVMQQDQKRKARQVNAERRKRSLEKAHEEKAQQCVQAEVEGVKRYGLIQDRLRDIEYSQAQRKAIFEAHHKALKVAHSFASPLYAINTMMNSFNSLTDDLEEPWLGSLFTKIVGMDNDFPDNVVSACLKVDNSTEHYRKCEESFLILCQELAVRALSQAQVISLPSFEAAYHLEDSISSPSEALAMLLSQVETFKNWLKSGSGALLQVAIGQVIEKKVQGSAAKPLRERNKDEMERCVAFFVNHSLQDMNSWDESVFKEFFTLVNMRPLLMLVLTQIYRLEPEDRTLLIAYYVDFNLAPKSERRQYWLEFKELFSDSDLTLSDETNHHQALYCAQQKNYFEALKKAPLQQSRKKIYHDSAAYHQLCSYNDMQADYSYIEDLLPYGFGELEKVFKVLLGVDGEFKLTELSNYQVVMMENKLRHCPPLESPAMKEWRLKLVDKVYHLQIQEGKFHYRYFKESLLALPPPLNLCFGEPFFYLNGIANEHLQSDEASSLMHEAYGYINGKSTDEVFSGFSEAWQNKLYHWSNKVGSSPSYNRRRGGRSSEQSHYYGFLPEHILSDDNHLNYFSLMAKGELYDSLASHLYHFLDVTCRSLGCQDTNFRVSKERFTFGSLISFILSDEVSFKHKSSLSDFIQQGLTNGGVFEEFPSTRRHPKSQYSVLTILDTLGVDHPAPYTVEQLEGVVKPYCSSEDSALLAGWLHEHKYNTV